MALNRVTLDELGRALSGRRIHNSCIHGSPWPHKVLAGAVRADYRYQLFSLSGTSDGPVDVWLGVFGHRDQEMQLLSPAPQHLTAFRQFRVSFLLPHPPGRNITGATFPV